jgi:O-acetyl-ADP-ribose deacetylase (regulator of RNase III)
MVIYKKGDLFQAPETIIAHGCNCSGGFGSGIAGQMAKYHPKAKIAYLEKYKEEYSWNLGEVQFVFSNSKIIANCATQFAYFPRTICHADYTAIEMAMNEVKKYAKLSRLTIAMPKIGAGLAGGDWNIIRAILEKVFDDYDVAVYEL